MTVPIRVESGLLADWRRPSPETCVYRIYDANDVLLYIGITNNPTIRWSEHGGKPWWRNDAHRYDIRWYASRDVARALEKEAIISERPKYNEVHRNPSMPPLRARGADGRPAPTLSTTAIGRSGRRE